MKKFILSVAIFTLIVPASCYGMKNMSKKMPKINLPKKNFSPKVWKWGKGWNNAKNYNFYSKQTGNNLFNKPVTPSVQDVKIENTSFINEDVDVHERTFDVLKYGGKNMKINLSDLKQSSKFIQKIISTWKAIKDGPLRKFFESIPWLRDRKTIFGKSGFTQAKFKHEEQTGGSYWKYFLVVQLLHIWQNFFLILLSKTLLKKVKIYHSIIHSMVNQQDLCLQKILLHYYISTV